MINEGVTAALGVRDATRNGNDSHTSGTGARRPVQFLVNDTGLPKMSTLNFKALKELLDSLSGLKRWSLFTA
ncbi:hypothetical protein Tco_0503573 [Tanacetum coccineum]